MNTANTKPTARDDVAVARVLIPHRRIPLLAPAQEMICSRCGTTYDPTEDQQDRVLLLAACCPRCDGQLTPRKATRPSDRRATTSADLAPTTD
jgi:hypothetical protein